MNLFLLLSAIVILACVLCNRLSNKLGVPTLLAFILLKTIRNRSLKNGLNSVINLAVLSAGLIKGLFRPQRDPRIPPDNKVIHEQVE